MKKFLVALCLVVVLGFFWAFRGTSASHQNMPEHQGIHLPVQAVQNQSFTYTKSFIGSVLPIKSVAVVPYLSGFLKEVRVQSGEEVREGDVLFLLDERIPLADLNQAKEAVSQAAAARENAKIYYDRMKNTDAKAISPTDLEQAKTEFEAAQAAYQKALAAQNQAQTVYDYTIIQAPISGWVGNISATAGEYLSPEGSPLATIISFSPVRLTFSVPMSESQTEFVSDQAKLQVILADEQPIEFQDFQVVRNNQVDSTTDSLSFFIDVPNNEKQMTPGAYAEIRFLYPKDGILVDKNWIALTPLGAEAVILKNGIVEKKPVEIGAPIGHQYWIKSGLTEGDLVITVPVSDRQIGQAAQGVPK